MEQGSGSVTSRLRRVLSMARRGPAPDSPTESLDDLEGAREAYMGRKERRAARRAHQRAVRRARNRARLRRAGQPIPPELQEPEDREDDEGPAPEADPEPDAEDASEDDRDPEIEPRAEAKMRRGPTEDKMLRPHEAGAEDKDEDDALEGLDSVEFGHPTARELAEAQDLTAADFHGRTPSGVHGFLTSDVREIVDADPEP